MRGEPGDGNQPGAAAPTNSPAASRASSPSRGNTGGGLAGGRTTSRRDGEGGRATLRGSTRSAWDEFRRAAPQDTAVLGRPVPFVGRRQELERLYDVLRDALNKRDCRAAWVHGAAGIGKSRLIAELERAVAPAKRGVCWLEVNAATDAGGPPSLVGRVFAALLDVGSPPAPDAMRALQVRLAQWIGDRHANEGMAIVGPVLGLGAPGLEARDTVAAPDSQPELALQLLGSLLRARGRQGPLVLCIDASRGASEEVVSVCRTLVEALAGIPAALIIESRRAPARGVPATPLPLTNLAAEAAVLLVQHILQGVSGAPAGLDREIVERAAGVPERIVDLVRGMVAANDLVTSDEGWRWRGQTEPGGGPLLPEPVAGRGDSLPDRIARLPDELRGVVEAAAIYGQTFQFGGVLSVLRGMARDPTDAMTDRDRTRLKAGMMQLQSVELIRFIDEKRRRGDVAFIFEVPGDAPLLTAHMAPDRRRLAARLAAQWLQARPIHDPIADPARIAELLLAGGRLRQAAERYLQAGEAARSVGQSARAVEMFAAGARLVETDDADLGADLRIAQGGGMLRLGKAAEAEPVLLEALQMARTLEDDRRCGVAQLRIAQVARVRGRYDTAISFLEGALKHLRVAGEHRWIADVMDELGLCHSSRGAQDALRDALAHFLKALALRRRSEDRRVLARSLCHIARIHVARGHFDDALDAGEEAVQICELISDRWGLALARLVMGEVHAAAGRYRAAETVWTAAAELASELGDPARRLEIVLAHAEAAIANGQWQDAAALLVDQIDAARRLDDPELRSGLYRIQASVSLEREAYETADLDSQKAVEVARETHGKAAVARALLVRACVLGTRALVGTGATSTVLDRETTNTFDEAIGDLAAMGDLQRQLAGLRSYVHYLTQRGGGPRLTEVDSRLREAQRQLAKVSGRSDRAG